MTLIGCISGWMSYSFIWLLFGPAVLLTAIGLCSIEQAYRARSGNIIYIVAIVNAV